MHIQAIDPIDGRTINVKCTKNDDGSYSFPGSFGAHPLPGDGDRAPVGVKTASLVGFDVGSVANGAQVVSPDLAMPGAVFGDFLLASCSISLGGLTIEGIVKAPDVVGFVLTNSSGAAVDLAAATYRILKLN